MHFFERDGLHFHYIDRGEGLPFVFQHGLTGDVTQPLGLYEEQPGIRFIALDCRAHGATRPLGDPDKLNFSTFADDIVALLDHLEIDRAVVGGISMGAGVALNLTLRYPDRVRGLIVSRPAWLTTPLPPGLRAHVFAARLMQEYGGPAGRERYLESDMYHHIHQEAPHVADGLLAAFDQPERAVRLDRLPRDCPNHDALEWHTISVPALVLGNHHDMVHPFSYAETLAQAIPGAELKEITPKTINDERYTVETQVHVREFLQQFGVEV